MSARPLGPISSSSALAFCWASVSPGTEWGSPARPPKPLPALGLCWWHCLRALTGAAHPPVPWVLTGCSRAQGQPGACAVSLSAVASLPYFCTERCRPRGPGESYSWIWLPAFPHSPVLPPRPKLQRLKSEGNKNSGRGSWLPAGARGVCQCVCVSVCVCVLGGSLAQSGSEYKENFGD